MYLPPVLRLLPAVCTFLAFAGTASAWTPGTSRPRAASEFSLKPWNRTDVLAFYNTVYRASESAPSRIDWVGNVNAGIAGTTSAAFKNDVRRRVNFYRALAGLPSDITFDDLKSAKCQQAALMFSANESISHFPPVSWTHFSLAGSEAAGASNIAIGSFGPESADRYMIDDGANNRIVGHRRWLLFPRAAEMGTGDIPPSSQSPATNAIWVNGDFKPSGSMDFIPWPPRGYFPANLVPSRWSVSRTDADFSGASVTMTRNGTNVPVTVISRNDNGAGDNTLVWVPQTPLPKGGADINYRVSITGVISPDGKNSFRYLTRAFNPAVLGQQSIIRGPKSIRTLRTQFPFTPVTQADGYNLNIEKIATNGRTEGAEGQKPKVRDKTSGAYPLVQQDVKHTGSSAFHLTFPSFEAGPQTFELSQDVIPETNSRLLFRDLFRYSATGCRLSAEVSQNDGRTWVRVWSRLGNGETSSAAWDSSFRNRSVPLGKFAGKPIRVRFSYTFQRSAFIGTSTDLGVFVDDIRFTNAGTLTRLASRWVPSSRTFVRPSDYIGNGVVKDGESIIMRMRPRVGTVWYPFGPLLTVKVISVGGTGPEIDVEYPRGNALTSRESAIRFGAARVGENSSFRTLIIRNNGTKQLNLGKPILRGAHPGDFRFQALSANRIQPGKAATLRLHFRPKLTGTRKAVIDIPSTDPNESPFRITLSGFGAAAR